MSSTLEDTKKLRLALAAEIKKSKALREQLKRLKEEREKGK